MICCHFGHGAGRPVVPVAPSSGRASRQHRSTEVEPATSRSGIGRSDGDVAPLTAVAKHASLPWPNPRSVGSIDPSSDRFRNTSGRKPLKNSRQARWRRLDGAHLLPLVRAGITFIDRVQHTIQKRSRRFRSALPVRRTNGTESSLTRGSMEYSPGSPSFALCPARLAARGSSVRGSACL